MYSEDDLLPISALQHLLYCERQAALIHIERLWAENRLTVEGRQLHERTHGERAGPRGGGMAELRRTPDGGAVRIVRSVALRSLRLGLFGVADTVEFHAVSMPAAWIEAMQEAQRAAVQEGQRAPPAVPFPVEYKRGKPKKHDADRVQLCAQALCLEEMLAVPVTAGALFYGRTRRRESVAFDDALRRLTEQTAARLHDLIASRRTPPAVYEKFKCGRCSLIHLCMPDAPHARNAASRYLDRALASAAAATVETISPDST